MTRLVLGLLRPYRGWLAISITRTLTPRWWLRSPRGAVSALPLPAQPAPVNVRSVPNRRYKLDRTRSVVRGTIIRLLPK
jgi:hypothetical protein